MRNIALKISYDGTNFSGWQRQIIERVSKNRTVQEEIEKALAKIHGHSIDLIGSGRTDAGVHAACQVANFYTDIESIPADKFVPALNSLMPRDVRIISAYEVPQDFHARFSALSRTYRFFLYCGSFPLAHELPYVWHIKRWPCVDVLNQMASFLYGELDCTTFAAAGDQSKSKFRYFYGASFIPEGEKLIFEVTANAFLWKMVRSITGSLLDLEQKGLDPIEFKKILVSCDRKKAGPTAPGTGLFLWNVRYPQVL